MKSDPPRFVADRMLGSLAKKLRLLGLDTSYSSESDNNELRYLVKSQGRILLTRDLKLAKGLGDQAWLVSGNDVRKEFISIADMLSADSSGFDPFSLCLDCNATLTTVTSSHARGKVPPYVLSTQERFSSCPSCGKIFWDGTHRKRMEGEVEWMRRKLSADS